MPEATKTRRAIFFLFIFLFERGDSLLWSNGREGGLLGLNATICHLPQPEAIFFTLVFCSSLLLSFRTLLHFTSPAPLPAMSIVSITQVNVLDNPTHFANPYQFEITFECIAPLAAGK